MKLTKQFDAKPSLCSSVVLRLFFVNLINNFRFFSLLLQNVENNNNEIKWKRTPPLSRSKTLPDLLYQEHDAPLLPFNKDSPAPCKIFPKAPKIALTIDDITIGDFQRRKSSGSSVNSNHSTIEPHIYDFQENDRNVESSLIIRFAC
jgi:hypothetical protein